jgi:hypothetical protein
MFVDVKVTLLLYTNYTYDYYVETKTEARPEGSIMIKTNSR